MGLKGADTNAFARNEAYLKMTPLHYAVLTENLAAVRLLLNWGADICIKNADGLTAGTLAQQHGYIDVAKVIDAQKNYAAKFSWPSSLPQAKTLQVVTARKNNVIDFLSYKHKKSKHFC